MCWKALDNHSVKDICVTVRNTIRNAAGGHDVHKFSIVNIHGHWVIINSKTLMGSHKECNANPEIPLGSNIAHTAYYIASPECGIHLIYLLYSVVIGHSGQ